MAKIRKKARKFGRRATLLATAAAAVGLVGYRLVEKVGLDKHPADRFVIKRVIDGDTVELEGGDKLRLLAIDTPEKGERFHDEATNYLAHLALHKSARIEYGQTRRDHYGRLLGFLYVDDTLFVNRAMLDTGFAYLYLFQDNELDRKETKELLDAQRSAIARRVSLYSVAHEKEDYYVANTGSFRFHRPWCESVKDIKPGHYQEFKSREEALELGLSPCRNCKP